MPRSNPKHAKYVIRHMHVLQLSAHLNACIPVENLHSSAYNTKARAVIHQARLHNKSCTIRSFGTNSVLCFLTRSMRWFWPALPFHYILVCLAHELRFWKKLNMALQNTSGKSTESSKRASIFYATWVCIDRESYSVSHKHSWRRLCTSRVRKVPRAEIRKQSGRLVRHC